MVEQPVEDSRQLSTVSEETEKIPDGVREFFAKQEATHPNLAPLKHESDLPDKAKLGLSMKTKEEDSLMQSTDIQTGKSEYHANVVMAREQPPISSGPLTTIGSFIYHNFEFIDNASLIADSNLEPTDLNLMLRHASMTSKTDI